MDATNHQSEESQEMPSYTETNAFFGSAPPLKDEEEITRKIQDFIESNSLRPGKCTPAFEKERKVYFLFSFLPL